MEWRWSWTFGKEYELAVSLGFPNSEHKSEDSSGPSEIRSPAFRKVERGVFFEYFLFRVYGASLFNYFRTASLSEEKGNHFHFTVWNNERRRLDYYLLYEVYYVTAPLFLMCRKLLTLNERFRNTIDRWCENFIDHIRSYRDLYNLSSRRYSFMTFNRNRKRALTVEVRVSESSVVLDLCAFTIAFGVYLILKNEVKVNLQKFKRYCAWVDRTGIAASRPLSFNVRKLHLYLLERRPLELSLPAPQDKDINILDDLTAIIPLEQVDAPIKILRVKDNTFRYLVQVAERGLKEYGQDYVNASELLNLLGLFRKEYVEANRSRVEFVFYVYSQVKRSIDERKLRYMILDCAKWLIEE